MKDFTNYPLMLNVKDIVEIFGISRDKAYDLVNSKGFPTVKIGKRIVVPKEHLLKWIKDQVEEDL